MKLKREGGNSDFFQGPEFLRVFATTKIYKIDYTKDRLPTPQNFSTMADWLENLLKNVS